MKRLIILTLLSLTFIPAPQESSPITNIYFPMLYASRNDGMGLQIQRWTGPTNADSLEALQVEFVRVFFGDDTGQNVYQIYLVGGWDAVDAYVLADIESIKAYSEPIISFTHGGLCKVPTNLQLNAYAAFLVEFVIRYDITYFEAWNEADNKGGNSALFGCFGDQNTSKLIYLIGKIRETLPDGKMLGVSFAMGEPADFTMYTSIVPYLDWVAVHHYGVWSGGVVTEPYPGTITQLYDLVAPQDIPIFLTEVNLRDPLTLCTPAFRQAQMEYNQGALKSPFEIKIILVYAGGANWQCTGIKGSITEEMLKFSQEDWW